MNCYTEHIIDSRISRKVELKDSSSLVRTLNFSDKEFLDPFTRVLTESSRPSSFTLLHKIPIRSTL